MAVGDRYYRFERFSPQQVFKWIDAGRKRPMLMDGYRLDGVMSNRLLTYHRGGCTCLACGRVGTYFYAEADVGHEPFLKWYFNPLDNPLPMAHLNLYGQDRNGHKFMITSDHVIPRSRGGGDGVENRVPLCATCNMLKGNDPDWLTDLPKNAKGHPKHRPDRQLKIAPVKKDHTHA